jgi:hypothetical protein
MMFSCALQASDGGSVRLLADLNGSDTQNRFGFRATSQPWPGTIVFRQAAAISLTRTPGRIEIVIGGTRAGGGAPSSFEVGLAVHPDRGETELEIRRLAHDGGTASGRCTRMPDTPVEIAEEPRS